LKTLIRELSSGR